jgi:citrate lyase synthetase
MSSNGVRVVHIPQLKRIKVSSEEELHNWLRKNSDLAEEVMLVTCGQKSRNKHISSAVVRRVLSENGWSAGKSYTLVGNLEGHIARSN